jgi:hypothetical protein
MGTPHQGGNGVQLGRILANVASVFVATDDRLFKHLERDSEWLLQQLGQYGPISGEFVTKFAYEEYQTAVAPGKRILVSTCPVFELKLHLLSHERSCLERQRLCQDRRTLNQSSFMQTTKTWSSFSQNMMLAMLPSQSI